MNPTINTITHPDDPAEPQSAKRIAVALQGGTLAKHFSLAETFAVFRPSGLDCGTTVFRVRYSQCGGRNHGKSCGKGEHRSILHLLEGCDVILCGGMGQPIADALRAQGIRPFVTDATGAPEEICRRFLCGELPVSATPTCQHTGSCRTVSGVS